MITAIYKLPDLSVFGNRKYSNRMLTAYGLAGRSVDMPAGLKFYKFIVTHGECVLEYVFATTQEWDANGGTIFECYSGITYNYDASDISLVPVSVKMMLPSNGVSSFMNVNSYLFADTVSYALYSLGADPSNRIEMFDPPNSFTSDLWYPMVEDQATGGISMDTLLERLSSFDKHMNIPYPTYSLDLTKVVEGSNVPGSRDGFETFKALLCLNDLSTFNHIFSNILYASKYNSSIMGHDMLDVRYNAIYNVLYSEPVLAECMSTSSVVPFMKLAPFISKNCDIRQASKCSVEADGNPAVMLDSESNCWNMLAFIETVQSCSLVEFEIVVEITNAKMEDGEYVWTSNGKIVSKNEWFADTNGGIPEVCTIFEKMTAHMSCNRNAYKTDARLVKTYLDEVIMEFVVDGIYERYYVPLWYYNLASPANINHGLFNNIFDDFMKSRVS